MRAIQVLLVGVLAGAAGNAFSDEVACDEVPGKEMQISRVARDTYDSIEILIPKNYGRRKFDQIRVTYGNP